MSTDDAAPSPALAHAKEVGVDVEFHVVDALEALRLADDPDAYYDATTTAPLEPETLAGLDVPAGMAVPVVPRGVEVEVKACRLEQSNGDRMTPGRYTFKGRDEGQHAALLDAAGYYVLAVHRGGSDRALAGLAVVPVTVVDERLRGSWYAVDRCEGHMARLAWPRVLDRAAVLDGGEQA